MKNLFCTNMGMFPMYSNNARKLAEALLNSRKHKSQFINQLVLYDQLIIPTSNLMAVPVLRMWLGEDCFKLLIRESIIQFVRHDDWLSYAGNGGGLSFFKFIPTDPQKHIHLGSIGFLPIEEALDYLLKNTSPVSSQTHVEQLKKLILENTIQIDASIYHDKLKHETYTDIFKSPILLPFFNLRNEIGTSLDNLVGIESNKVKVHDPHSESIDSNAIEIDTILKLAFKNFLFSIATELDVSDIAGDRETYNLFWAKGQRFGFSKPTLDQYTRILDFEGIPNIGELFSSGQIGPFEVLKIRELKSTQVFKEWLDINSRDNNSDVIEEYRRIIQDQAWINSVPVKMIRIAVQGIGGILIDPIITPSVLAAADSFLLEKWAKRKSPSLFINDVRIITRNERTKMHAPGKLRNSPCPCGSGKKFKNCCGK